MSAASVQQAVLDALRASPRVKAIFGDPARIIDDQSEAPAYPYAQLETHAVRDASASEKVASEHVMSFTVFLRSGGFTAADDALQALRIAAEAMTPAAGGEAFVLIQIPQSDVLRAGAAGAFRGTLRLRLISEEI